MSIFSRRSSKLTRRLDRIDKEMSSVEKRLRSLKKHVDEQGDSVLDHAGSLPRKMPVPAPSPVAAQARTVNRTPTLPQRPYQGPDFAGRVLSSPRGALVGPTPSVESQAFREKVTPHEDEQFASYFMSGGLKKTDVPLRQERHVQRAKALFLLLFFGLLLFALVFFKVYR